MPDTEEKARTIFLTEGRLLIGVFIAGVGLILWLVNSVLNPLTILQQDIVNIRDNHIHTVEVAINQMQASIIEQGLQISRLQTIIEERIPAKK